MTCFGCQDTGKDRFTTGTCPVCRPSADDHRYRPRLQREIDDLYQVAGSVGSALHLAATSSGRARDEYLATAARVAHRSHQAATRLMALVNFS